MLASSSRLGLRAASSAQRRSLSSSISSVIARPAAPRTSYGAPLTYRPYSGRIVNHGALRPATFPCPVTQGQRYGRGQGRPYASASGPASTTDPALTRALEMMDDATQLLESGDLEGAKAQYGESLRVQETSAAWFNLGVCEYHLKNTQPAIAAWEKSIALTPSSDAHTNLASAYILSQPPQAALAIKHLTAALELSPDDPEIAFNLAAVLESTDNLDTALTLYQRAEKGGIERASQNIRSVSAKILAKRAEATSSTSSPTSA